LLIFVASAISFSEIARISRSRRNSSPKEASSECVCGSGSGTIGGILPVNPCDAGKETCVLGKNVCLAAAGTGTEALN